MKKEYEASMVVEAGIIFPLTMILVWSLILLLFKLYDRNVITEGRYICALRADRYIENSENVENIVETKLQKEVIDRLILKESRVKAGEEANRQIYSARPVEYMRNKKLVEKILDISKESKEE